MICLKKLLYALGADVETGYLLGGDGVKRGICKCPHFLENIAGVVACLDASEQMKERAG
jgi:hypothetical protein